MCQYNTWVDVTIIGSDNGLALVSCQSNIWANTDIVLIEHLETNFNETGIKIRQFSYEEVHLNMLYAHIQLFCLGLILMTALRWYFAGMTRIDLNSKEIVHVHVHGRIGDKCQWVFYFVCQL